MAKTNLPEVLALLRRDGWVQNVPYDGAKSCINWALKTVCAPGLHEADYLAVEQVIFEQFGIFGAISFNDTPGRTFADVELVLEKAALLRQEAPN